MGTFVESVSGNTATDLTTLTFQYAAVGSDSMVPTGITAGSYGDGSHVPVCSIDSAGRILSYSSIPMAVIDQGGQAWNAFADKYGVKGNGDADDWPGLQQWINDGITSGKKLILPPPPVAYRFTKPLVFNMANAYNPDLGTEPAGLWLECQPGYNSITGGYVLQYAGPSYQSALQFLGIQNGVIKGLTLNIGGADPSVTNVVALDFICTNSLPNMGNLHLEDINVLFQGSGGNHVAYRIGQSGRTVYDGVAVASSYDFSSAAAIFTSADVGSALIAIGIPSGTTISAVTDPSHVVLNNAATASGTSLMTTIGGGSASNISGTHMVNCNATGGGGLYGSIGCQIGGGEVVPFYAANCKMSELGCAWLAGDVQSLTVTTLPLQGDAAAMLPLERPEKMKSTGTISAHLTVSTVSCRGDSCHEIFGFR